MQQNDRTHRRLDDPDWAPGGGGLRGDALSAALDHREVPPVVGERGGAVLRGPPVRSVVLQRLEEGLGAAATTGVFSCSDVLCLSNCCSICSRLSLLAWCRPCVLLACCYLRTGRECHPQHWWSSADADGRRAQEVGQPCLTPPAARTMAGRVWRQTTMTMLACTSL